ncbi:hypothetical protein ACFFK0_29685 [Paenibacillus chartarius]|uniref:Pyridoxamine 5'-phosphate oxidase putative domain-containing protein n=1 Tax=Paenibacillus chartarius TaxID=747481 RepID=A0ABV6DV91_9BACL
MITWPEEVIGFLRRPVPIFLHVAAARIGKVPFTCRGYGFAAEPESGRLGVYVLKSQWLRLNAYMEGGRETAVLLTSGVDNESYQFKGTLQASRALNREDARTIEEQRKRVYQYAPHLLPVLHVSPSGCLAIELRIRAIYSQTPEPEAGSLIAGEGAEA